MSGEKKKSSRGHPKSTHPLARAKLVRALTRDATARQRYDRILSHSFVDAVVPQLPAEDLYFTLKEMGLADSTELVRLTSPEQFRTFVDLDAWRGDRLQAQVALQWLRAAATDDDGRRFHKKIHGLDIEILELILHSTCRIHDLKEDPDPELQGAFFRSPEGQYLVEFLVEGADYAGAKTLLDELYAEDPLRAARLLEAVRWETVAELEESALRWRNGRLQDLGFPEMSEAASYYFFVDPDKASPQLGKYPTVSDSFWLARIGGNACFFDRVAMRVPQGEAGFIERQLVTVLNAVLVANAVEVSALDVVQQTVQAAHDTLSVGLEHMSGGDEANAVSKLLEVPLKRIHQVGVSLGLRLKHRADRLVRSGKVSSSREGETVLDEPANGVLAGIRRKRPQYAVILDGLENSGEEFRSLRSLTDVRRLESFLSEAERQAGVMAQLGFNPGAQTHDDVLVSTEPSVSAWLLTALAQLLLHGRFEFRPLPASELVKFVGVILVDPMGMPTVMPAGATHLVERLREAGRAISSLHESTAVRLAETALQKLVEELGEPWRKGTLNAAWPAPLVLARNARGQ